MRPARPATSPLTQLCSRLGAIALAATAFHGAATAQVAGSVDPTFTQTSGANFPIYAVAVQPDGRILVGGTFTSIGGSSAGRIARLLPGGARDTSFNAGFGANAWVRDIQVQPDGKLVIVGDFTAVNNVSRNRVARLEANGAVDLNFQTGVAADGPVFCAAIQADGRILIGGIFTSVNSSPRGRIARLNTDGSLDASFAASGGADSTIWSISIRQDQRIWVAGDFLSLGGSPCARVGRLLSNGSLDSSFDPGIGPDGIVYDVAALPSGGCLIGGEFLSVDGAAKARIAQMLDDGSFDPSYAPDSAVDRAVRDIEVQPDGYALIGGEFAGLAMRLRPDGSKDTGFVSSLSGGPSVWSVAMQPDRRVLFAGNFTHASNAPAPRIVRVLGDSTCYLDLDGDGFGAGAPAQTQGSCGPSYSTLPGDCDDARTDVYPGAPEVCDGIDNNCDGFVDEGYTLTYCTAGTSVSGCVPIIRGQGAPSSSNASGFSILVEGVPGQRMGLIFYGTGAISQPQPWALGSSSYLCVFYPVSRTGSQNAGGTAGSCTGTLQVDFNSYMAANPAAVGSPFAAGDVFHAQGWYRDPGASKGTNLSAALTYTLCN